MNINRNNYEEYFLLYADKELSAEEKSMVEMFVKQNADLEEEFVMLQQSVVKPDATVRLADKNSLYRSEGFIDKNNYEEKFLLYNDNELSLSEIEETEKFVLTNPSLQNEFTLLQKVKYEPDTSILFPDKSSLHKKENDSRIISFRWKALAAAVFLGIGLWTGIHYLQPKKPEKFIATKQIAEPKVKVPIKPVEPKQESKAPLVITDQNSSAPKIIEKNFDNKEKKQIQPIQNTTVKNIQPVNNKPKLNIVEKKKESVAVIEPPVNNNLINKKTNELPEPINTTPEPNNKTINTATPSSQNNYTKPASYIADAEVKSDNYVFYNVTAEEFRKSKVGNFFKKVKRAIERKLPFKNSGFKAEANRDNEN
jgi:hypothetical protein